MNTVLRIISYIGLAFSLVPAFLVWKGVITFQTDLTLLVVGMVLWFGTAIFWIKEDKTED